MRGYIVRNDVSYKENQPRGQGELETQHTSRRDPNGRFSKTRKLIRFIGTTSPWSSPVFITVEHKRFVLGNDFQFFPPALCFLVF